MGSAPRYNGEASFRPRELREYGEPVVRTSIRLEVRQTFWQRLLKALGL